MLVPGSASLSAKEIIAALERRIEQLSILAEDQALLWMDQDAAETQTEVANLQNLLHQFRAWVERRAARRPKRTAQVFNFRQRKVARPAP